MALYICHVFVVDVVVISLRGFAPNTRIIGNSSASIVSLVRYAFICKHYGSMASLFRSDFLTFLNEYVSGEWYISTFPILPGFFCVILQYLSLLFIQRAYLSIFRLLPHIPQDNLEVPYIYLSILW